MPNWTQDVRTEDLALSSLEVSDGFNLKHLPVPCASVYDLPTSCIIARAHARHYLTAIHMRSH